VRRRVLTLPVAEVRVILELVLIQKHAVDHQQREEYSHKRDKRGLNHIIRHREAAHRESEDEENQPVPPDIKPESVIKQDHRPKSNTPRLRAVFSSFTSVSGDVQPNLAQFRRNWFDPGRIWSQRASVSPCAPS